MNGKLILALLESDALLTEGPAVITFLKNFGTAAGDPFKLTAAWAQLQGDFVGMLPQFEATVAEQIAGALTTKLQAAIAAAQAAASSATATAKPAA
jgi:hypothetical protein